MKAYLIKKKETQYNRHNLKVSFQLHCFLVSKKKSQRLSHRILSNLSSSVSKLYYSNVLLIPTKNASRTVYPIEIFDVTLIQMK